MFTISKIFMFIQFQYILVQCSIPNLSVRKLDKKLIQRKRQDTLEMCKIFNSENERIKRLNELNHLHPNDKQNGDKTKTRRRRRSKRNVDAMKFGNPILNLNDAKRVEDIVDKLYDDVQDNGERVTYRHKDLDGISTAKMPDIKNNTSRRFDFAPASLLGPDGTPETSHDSDDHNIHNINTIKIPWPKTWKQGIVPYFIDSKTYDTQLSDVIMRAFDYFEKTTCIRLQRLRERPTDKDSLQRVEWLYITNPTGIKQCVHSNERKENKGVQMVVFGYDCLSLGEIIHEVMHVLGFSHEHTRSDRDQYVTIMWDNIKPGYKKYFEINSVNTLEHLPYDYASVLHYPPRAFSKNGQVTILTESATKLGQREGLSEIDVEKISMIYGSECVNRNRNYLLNTCPGVVKANTTKANITQEDIKNYFKDRLWPFGIVNYKLRDKMEFSAEERDNIRAVIQHIEKETCIEFRDLTAKGDSEDDKDYHDDNNLGDSVNININMNKQTTTDTSEEITDSLTEDNINRNEQSDDINGTESETLKKSGSSGEEIKASGDSINKLTLESDKTDDPSANEIKRASSSSDDSSKDSLRVLPENKIQGSDKNITRNSKIKSNRIRRAALPSSTASPSRRHAENILILARSPQSGCTCPEPGRPNGNKVLEINTDCFNSVNDLLHLFVHILGLDHQHNMYDRDSYLRILWDNISPEIKLQMTSTLPPAASVGFTYDYQSVMHYPWLQIKNGVTNIMYPIWNDGWAMGHWQGLSSIDVKKINLLYSDQCQERTKQTSLDDTKKYKI